MGFRVEVLGFMVEVLRFRIEVLGFRVEVLGFRVWGLGTEGLVPVSISLAPTPTALDKLLSGAQCLRLSITVIQAILAMIVVIAIVAVIVVINHRKGNTSTVEFVDVLGRLERFSPYSCQPY